MPRGLCYVDVFSVSVLIELPEEGRGVEFPRKPAILAIFTIIIIPHNTYRNTLVIVRKTPTHKLLLWIIIVEKVVQHTLGNSLIHEFL